MPPIGKELYISVDPGQTVGVATWDVDGHLIHKSKMPSPTFDTFLEALTRPEYPNKVIKFIIEEYRVYGSKSTAHIGSKLPTVQCIGKVKMIARLLGVPVVEQPATKLRVAAKWAGVKIPGGHIPDEISAYLHGYYYLHKAGLIPARVLETEYEG